MRILIETIPHDQQAYTTCGDWRQDADGTIRIRVSELGNWRREALVAVHELVEVLICKHNGVTTEMVDKFDKDFEAHRHPDNVDEPGDDPKAPYMREHCIATGIERILAAELCVSWKEYEQEINSLPEVPEK